MPSLYRYKSARRTAFVSATVNSLLAISKILVGYIGRSHALIADGLHSFSDLITDGLVLIAAKAGGRTPDKEHPYGHQRIETITTILIAIILVFVAASIVYESLSHTMTSQIKSPPAMTVIFVAIISIIANEGLYRYTLYVGKKIYSNLLVSNAWHNRSDALTSIIVLISVVGTLLGFHYFDAIGAIIIALWIFKIGMQLMWNGIKELIDTGVDTKTLTHITACIQQVPGVRSVHQLRTRLHAGNIFIDVHILVDPFISVSEGHHIGEQVHHTLMQQFKNIVDVVAHIDPEDDESTSLSIHLPTREEIMEKLKLHWRNLPGYPEIKKTTLHYLDGRLHIELDMPQFITQLKEQKQLIESYRQATKEMNEIASVRIRFIPE